MDESGSTPMEADEQITNSSSLATSNPEEGSDITNGNSNSESKAEPTQNADSVTSNNSLKVQPANNGQKNNTKTINKFFRNRPNRLLRFNSRQKIYEKLDYWIAEKNSLSFGMTEEEKNMLDYYIVKMSVLINENKALHSRLASLAKENVRLLQMAHMSSVESSEDLPQYS